MTPDEKLDIAISCLMHAIEDTQETIRAYDTKAEILGILLTLAIGITNFNFFEQAMPLSKGFLISSWISGIVAIGLLGAVLHPKTNQFKDIKLGAYTPSCTYFLSNVTATPHNTVTAMADRALNTDWSSELMYESMKLSIVREKKHYWFVHSLRLTGLTLLLIAAGMILGA